MPVNILNLPGLRVLDFKETETDYHVKAQPTVVSRLCPHCGRSNETVTHALKTLYIRDLPAHGKSVAIHLDVPRLRCKPCDKTFTAAVPEVDTARQMTERLARWVGRQALEYTYAEIAKQVGIDEKTVRNVFDEYVATLEKEFKRETPVWLGIDEIKLGRFRAIFTNIQGRALIDMLPDRYYTSIVKFLESLPDKEHISHISTDMWRAHKLFAKRQADLNDEQWLTVSGWLNSFPMLQAAYDLKERLYKVYEVETKEEAWGEYLAWEASIPPELTKPFRPVKTAFRNWKPYILNYFDDERITNAFTESFNAKVRKVYRDGRGYTFERLRAKVLFTDKLQKRVPVQEQVKVKKKKPKFEDVAMQRMAYYMTMDVCEERAEYEVKIRTRQAILGTDLSTLEDLFDSGQF